MPRGRRTPLAVAATIHAMYEHGEPQAAIAETLDLPHQTVSTILHGSTPKWEEIIKNQDTNSFGAHRRLAKQVMQAASIELAKKALVQVDASLDKASALQAATVYGILRDKERLDAGEATQNIAIVARVDFEQLDVLAAKLGQALLPGAATVKP